MVLAIDGSASVSFDEFGLIAGGIGAALRDPAVVAGLTGGPAGASIVCALLWSDATQQDVLVEWTRVSDAGSAEAFARAVEDVPRTVRAGATAIGAALLVALRLLAEAPVATARQVVDVAGDGRSNDGIAPGPVRDRMVAAGIVINGLCVLHEEADLVASYEAEVIGGEGSFAIACADYGEFAEAMARKMAREVA